MGVPIEALGGDRYRVGLPDGPVDVAGAAAALALAESAIGAEWDRAKHPRARGGKFARVPGHPKISRAERTRRVKAAQAGPKPEPVGDIFTAIGQAIDVARAKKHAKDVPASKLGSAAKDVPGAPPPGKATRRQAPLGSPGRPIKTDDVAEAARELAAGRYVQLRSKDEVSTLLKELQREVQAARDKGEKAPDINLCKVSVKGTNLFCAQSKGIARVQMPQLKGDAEKARKGSRASKLTPDKRGEVSIEAQFRDHLVKHGVKVEDGEELASHLKATQDELNGAKVAGIADAIDRGVVIEGPGLFISKDNYVVDGHHRWAATIGVDYEDGKDDLKMPVQRIDMPIIDILREANAFAEDWGLPQSGLGDFSPKMLAGAPPLVGEKGKAKKVEEASRTPDGKWRGRMPDGRQLDFATREIAEASLRKEWDSILHPRARGGKFADKPGKLDDAMALSRGRSVLWSPGRAGDRIPSVTKHAMGFEPGDYLVPTRSFSVYQGRGYSPLTNGTAAFHPWHRYKVKQIIGTNQLTVEGDQPGTGLYIPTFDKSSVKRVSKAEADNIAAGNLGYLRSPGAVPDRREGRMPDGTRVRLRREPAGAVVVEEQGSDGRWSPNRFLGDEESVRAANRHFDALVSGGREAGARETAGRLRLGSELPRRVASPATHSEYPRSPGRVQDDEAAKRRRAITAPGQYAPQAPYGDRLAAARRNAQNFGTYPSWYGIGPGEMSPGRVGGLGLGSMEPGEEHEFEVGRGGDSKRVRVRYDSDPSYGDDGRPVRGAYTGRYTVTANGRTQTFEHGPHATTAAARKRGANPNAKDYAANKAREHIIGLARKAE